jgi:hypothetical protein
MVLPRRSQENPSISPPRLLGYPIPDLLPLAPLPKNQNNPPSTASPPPPNGSISNGLDGDQGKAVDLSEESPSTGKRKERSADTASQPASGEDMDGIMYNPRGEKRPRTDKTEDAPMGSPALPSPSIAATTSASDRRHGSPSPTVSSSKDALRSISPIATKKQSSKPSLKTSRSSPTSPFKVKPDPEEKEPETRKGQQPMKQVSSTDVTRLKGHTSTVSVANPR